MTIAPPRPKHAPLNALRAFEAAARLRGFAAAAEELAVTPGAVAQQIKTLEDWIGAPLFERRAQGVELSALGASALADFSAAFDQLGAASQRLRARAAPKEVRVAALPSVAQLWLSPRLPALRASSPDLTVSVTAMERPPNLAREPFDLSLFFEPAHGAAETLFVAKDVIFPVAAPEIARALTEPADLRRATLLTDAAWKDDWRLWAPDLSLAPTGPFFSLYALAVEEAVNGAGVLMGHGPLVERRLAAGDLVEPFRRRVALDRALTISVARPASDGGAAAALARRLVSS